jgi:hypothetical protein
VPEDTRALEEHTQWALTRGGRAGELGAHVPPDEVDELRIIANYLAAHPETTALVLETGEGGARASGDEETGARATDEEARRQAPHPLSETAAR